MRAAIVFVFLGAFLFAACGEDVAPMNNPDLAVNISPDMVMVAMTTCGEAIQCSQACTGSNAQTCSAACFGNVTPAAEPYATALLNCISQKCTSLGGDAGIPACDDPQSQACADCVQTACFPEASACFTH
jgi:hypothetical protein